MRQPSCRATRSLILSSRSDRLISDGSLIQRWLHERSRLPIQKDFHGVAREVNGEIVSAFGYDSFQPKSCALHTCTDRPYTRELLHAAFWIPFEQWQYERIYAIIQTGNAKSLNLAQRLGFRTIGATPDLWFGVLNKQECRWLMPPKRQRDVRRQLSSVSPILRRDRSVRSDLRDGDR